MSVSNPFSDAPVLITDEGDDDGTDMKANKARPTDDDSASGADDDETGDGDALPKEPEPSGSILPRDQGRQASQSNSCNQGGLLNSTFASMTEATSTSYKQAQTQSKPAELVEPIEVKQVEDNAEEWEIESIIARRHHRKDGAAEPVTEYSIE